MSPRLALVLYSAIILTIIVLAYLKRIPTELHEIPYYDSAGHFVLYGIWGFCFAREFNKPLLSFGNFKIANGFFIAVIIAIVEESLQRLSPARTFSLYDLGFGILGIAVACILLNFKTNLKN